MAIAALTDVAKEEGTYVVIVDIDDEDDLDVIPNDMTWSLTLSDGTVVNSREDIDYETDDGSGSGGTLGQNMNIVLHGDDLAVTDGADLLRIVTVKGHYDSAAGQDLEFNDKVKFFVENLAAV